MSSSRRASRHDQTAVRGVCEGSDGAFDLAGVAYVDWAHLHPNGRGHGLDSAELCNSGWIDGIAKDSRPSYVRRDLLEQFQQFCVQAVFRQHKAGGIAARLG